MKLLMRTRIFVFLLGLLLSLAHAATAPQSLSMNWPKNLQLNDQELTFYQPQIQSLENNHLSFQMALAMTDSSGNKTHYGSLQASCRLDIDKNENLAICNNVAISNLQFPNDQENQAQWSDRLKQQIAGKSFSLSLSSISAGLAVTEAAKVHGNPNFDFTAPEVLVAFKPTALVTIDGTPQLRPVENTSLMRVINTPFIIILDTKTGVYYLKAGQVWMQAKAINGAWSKISSLPDSIAKIDKEQAQAKQTGSEKPVEAVIVSTKPASLIQVDGKPEFSPVEGTSLLYVSNTQDQVFLKIKSQEYFALISGRWYRSERFDANSKWVYVAPSDLPDAFRNIPADSDKAGVLASVPGSDEAQEAVIKNQIPQTAVVKRSEAKLTVKYDGKAQFVLIPGTTIYYARNTDKAVFRIGTQYYANYQGVWFQAAHAEGPWTVASEVPKVIYTIPPSSPHYNVTYSYIYGATPEVVYVGYTPGYTGSYVYQGTVIYGTGYYYPGWSGTVYYGYPVTWGFNFYYQPYGGWYPVAPYASPLWFGAGVATGIIAANHWNHGWFGPNRYYDYHGGHNKVNINVNHNTNVYNHWNKNTVVHRNNINNNLFNNNRVINRPHTEVKSSTNIINNKVNKQVVNRPTEIKRPNNVYTGKDGNIYRNHQGQWQQATPRGWEQNTNAGQVAHLNRQRQSRAEPHRSFESHRRFR